MSCREFVHTHPRMHNIPESVSVSANSTANKFTKVDRAEKQVPRDEHVELDFIRPVNKQTNKQRIDRAEEQAPQDKRSVINTERRVKWNMTENPKVSEQLSSSSTTRLFQRAPRQNKIYFLLHLHKSGGNSMCHLAKMNNMKISGDGCNVQSDQRCCGGENVTDQQRFARNTAYDFVASESYMYRQMDTLSYTYITVLRRSITRYRSHYDHVLRENPKIDISFGHWLEGQPDNWNMRHICGTRCMEKPKHSLDIEDFLFAAERLKNFSHVLFFEQYDRGSDVLAKHLGWHLTHVPHLNKAKRSSIRDIPYLKMSFLDDLLYDYAFNNSLANIPEQVVARMIVNITSNEPRFSSPCGGYCSKY